MIHFTTIDMDLRQLEMLLAVVQYGGYTRAGERLHVSHSAIHRQVRMLEEQIHHRVLVRVGRCVELTEVGRVLIRLAQQIQKNLSDAERQIADLDQLHAGSLGVGTSTNMLIFFVAPVLKRFRKEHPGIKVSITTNTADRVLAAITGGALDIGIVYAPRNVEQAAYDLKCEVLYDEDFVLAIGKKHPLVKRKVISLSDLAGLPLIVPLPKSHERQMIEHVFEKAGLVPTESMQLENEEAIERMVEADMGIGLLSLRRAVRDHIHYFRIPGHRFHCEVGMVFRKAGYEPKALAEFIRMCHEEKTSLIS